MPSRPADYQLMLLVVLVESTARLPMLAVALVKLSVKLPMLVVHWV